MFPGQLYDHTPTWGRLALPYWSALKSQKFYLFLKCVTCLFTLTTEYFVVTLFVQSDPTLERHFKGHRDTVTSVDFSCSMKQIGNYLCFSVVRHNILSLTCASRPPSHRLHGLLCDDLEHEASDASVSFWRTQRRRPLRPLFAVRPSAGFCLQRQDRPSLGAQHVSYKVASFSFSCYTWFISFHSRFTTEDNGADS